MRTKEKNAEYQRRYRAKHQDRVNKWTREYRMKNPERIAAIVKRFREKHDLRIRCKKYGTTETDYRLMIVRQENKCAICSMEFGTGKAKIAHIDHCHDTGKIRGLLCHNCNSGIAMFKENPSLLVNAGMYLAESIIDKIKESLE